MSDEPVSLSAASLQSSANAAWGKVLDKIYALLQTELTQAAEAGVFKTYFSIWNLSRNEENDISDPGGANMLNEHEEETL